MKESKINHINGVYTSINTPIHSGCRSIRLPLHLHASLNVDCLRSTDPQWKVLTSGNPSRKCNLFYVGARISVVPLQSRYMVMVGLQCFTLSGELL